MTGPDEVARLRRALDDAFARGRAIEPAKLPDVAPAVADELRSDLARYLCVLVSGFLQRAVVELCLERCRAKSEAPVIQYVSSRLEMFRNPSTDQVLALLGDFDKGWRGLAQKYIAGKRRDAVDSVVSNRNRIAHGDWVAL